MNNKRFLICISSLALVFLFAFGVFGAVSSGFKNWKLFDKVDKGNNVVAFDGDGNEMTSSGTYALPVSMSFLDIEPMVDVRGVSIPQSVVVNVDFTPSTVTWAKITWSVEFESNTGWASGKNVSNYVSVSPIDSNGHSATVTCLKAFGTQIELIAKVVDSTVSTSCLLNYMGRIEGFVLTGTTRSGKTVSLSTADSLAWIWDNDIISMDVYGEDLALTDINVVPVFGEVYTVSPVFQFQLGMSFTNEMWQALRTKFNLPYREFIGSNTDEIYVSLIDMFYNYCDIELYDLYSNEEMDSILRFMLNSPDIPWFNFHVTLIAGNESNPSQTFFHFFDIYSDPELRQVVASISLDTDSIIF